MGRQLSQPQEPGRPSLSKAAPHVVQHVVLGPLLFPLSPLFGPIPEFKVWI